MIMKTVCFRLFLFMGLLLYGCSDKLITLIKGDPAPEIETGEEKQKVIAHKYCASCTVAEYDIEKGRFPVPNEIVINQVFSAALATLQSLSSLGSAITAKAEDSDSEVNRASAGNSLKAVDPESVIRIPFDGPIQLKFDNKWKKGIYIVKWSNVKQRVWHWPDAIEIGGKAGKFKAVYQDSNHDLVLVPHQDTFAPGQRYLVVVSDQLRDQKGKKIQHTVSFSLYKSPVSFLHGFQPNEKYASIAELPLDKLLVVELLRKANQALFTQAEKLLTRAHITSIFSFSVKTQTALAFEQAARDQMFKTATLITPNDNDNIGVVGSLHTPITLSYITGEGDDQAMQQDVLSPTFDADGRLTAAVDQLDNNSQQYDVLPYFLGEKDWPLKMAASDQYGGDSLFAGEVAIKRIYLGHFPCLNFLSNGTKSLAASSPLAQGANANENSADPSVEASNNLNTNEGVQSLDPRRLLPWAVDFKQRPRQPQGDCPKRTNDFSQGIFSQKGQLDFWLAVPKTIDLENPRVVIYQHGLSGRNLHFIAIANRLAQYNIATIAIDIMMHGNRQVDTGKGDNFLLNSFIRPESPALTAGYLLQTTMDLSHLSVLVKTNPVILALLGLKDQVSLLSTFLSDTPAANLAALKDSKPSLYYIGNSLGGILGAIIGSWGRLPFQRMVLNVPGGDLADIILNSPRQSNYRYDANEQAAAASSAPTGAKASSSPTRSSSGQGGGGLSAMFGGGSSGAGAGQAQSLVSLIEIMSASEIIAMKMDPLTAGNTIFPVNFLLQQIIGDKTIAGRNTELLAQVMNLNATSFNDGDGEQNRTAEVRARWIFDPANYSKSADGQVAGHSFLLDAKTTATCGGQMQAIYFLLEGQLYDPTQSEKILAVCGQ